MGHSTLAVTMDLHVHVSEDVGHFEIAMLEKAREDRREGIKNENPQSAEIVLISRSAPGNLKAKRR